MKIAILTPHYGDTKAGFTLSLAALLIHAGRFGVRMAGEAVRPEITFYMHTSPRIDINREKLAEQALDHGSDFLLWLDADHTFPPETLAQLLVHMEKAQVVGCNYARRASPTTPVAHMRRGEAWCPIHTTQMKADARNVEQVDFMGLGVCLMAAGVFGAIERPWFAPHPIGEDGYFFEKLGKAGILAFVDHNLSWRVGHIGERVFTHADASA
jgi:hypothetical protein